MTSRLHARQRPLRESEFAQIPWLSRLLPNEHERAVSDLRVGMAQAGEMICRTGRPATYWFGVIDGLLKVSILTLQGRTTTYTGIAPGGWFGEGTVIKREAYRYDAQALRRSRVAGLPTGTFHWLLDHSIGFNRFIMDQLNERVGQFIGTLAAERTSDPEQRVAHSLVALANPRLFYNVGRELHITQQELAYLVGLSRQRVNQALHELAARKLVRVEYGRLRILDLPALRRLGLEPESTG
ncbi:MAG: Crp/Fnr family transcriptional regulator [Ottowia sp.]|nr:Crp/Fnr family transcriptional regulator [Ottowia sp.]